MEGRGKGGGFGDRRWGQSKGGAPRGAVSEPGGWRRTEGAVPSLGLSGQPEPDPTPEPSRRTIPQSRDQPGPRTRTSPGARPGTPTSPGPWTLTSTGPVSPPPPPPPLRSPSSPPASRETCACALARPGGGGPRTVKLRVCAAAAPGGAASAPGSAHPREPRCERARAPRPAPRRTGSHGAAASHRTVGWHRPASRAWLCPSRNLAAPGFP